MKWLTRLLGFGKSTTEYDEILPNGQRRSEIIAMRDRAIACGNSHIEPAAPRPIAKITQRFIEEEPPAEKDLVFSTTINGAECLAAVHSDYMDVVDVSDPDDYRHDSRRWADITFRGEKHGYAWPEGYWTYSAEDLAPRQKIEAWLCDQLGISAPPVEIGGIETSNRQQPNRDCIVHGRAEGLLVEATFNPNGWVIKLDINNHKGRLNTKTWEAGIPMRFQKAEKAICHWAQKELMRAKAE